MLPSITVYSSGGNSNAVYEWDEIKGWTLFTSMDATLDYSYPIAIPYNFWFFLLCTAVRIDYD